MDKTEDENTWIDGKRIEGYCKRQGYSSQESLDMREMHRLHLLYPDGGSNGSPQDALAAMADITPSQQALLMKMGKAKDPRFSDAFIRLAMNREYAKKILNAYLTDVKPALKLRSSEGHGQEKNAIPTA